MSRVSLAIVVFALPSWLLAQNVDARPGSTPLEWITLKVAEFPALSPDARHVAYRVHAPDWERKTSDGLLWVVSTGSAQARQLTTTGMSWAPAWSPDGRVIAFLSNQGSGTQVYLVSPDGGGSVQLTQAPNGVDGFKWSPDGTRIAYSSGEAVPRADSADVLRAKDFHVLGFDRHFSASLWTVPVSRDVRGPSQGERLTDATAFNVDDAFSWSPDGTRIAFSANDYAADESFRTWDIYVVGVADKTVRRVVADSGPQFFPLWSPDGSEIAFKTFVKGPRETYRGYSAGYVAVIPAGGGVTRLLTEQFDESATPLAWAPDGIFFDARVRTSAHLFRVDPATRVVRRVTEPATAIKTSFTFSRDFKTVAFIGQDSARFQEIYVAPIAGTATPRQLTRMGEQLRGWPVGTREVITWTSADGTPIEGVLVTPPDFDRTKKYPLLVVAHTGPLGADLPTVTRDFPYNADLYAMRGILVLRPNYRGSIGYGARIRSSLVRSQGLPVYEDLIAGVDYLIAQGFVDSARVGAAGWSAGAHPVAFGSVWDNRFRAVSILEGGIDWEMFYTLGPGAGTARDYALATPWEDPDYYRAASPFTYAGRASTPTLIQHGDADPVAPIAAAYTLRRALMDRRVPVRMVVFHGMGHVPQSLPQLREIAEQNLDWFEYWLLGRSRAR